MHGLDLIACLWQMGMSGPISQHLTFITGAKENLMMPWDKRAACLFSQKMGKNFLYFFLIFLYN